MNSRRVSSFIESVLSDRRPRRFKGGPIDADVLRVAIALRASRPGDGVPEEQFVAHLRQELALPVGGAAAPPARSVVRTRARLTLGAAAVVTMLSGTVAATATVDHVLAAANARPVTHGQLLQMGRFETPDGHTVGQIVAYRGDPSWVFMSIRDPGLNGTLGCRIEMHNGGTAAAGTFVVHNGVGEFARPISADVSRFRGATLLTSAGSVLATASFAGI